MPADERNPHYSYLLVALAASSLPSLLNMSHYALTMTRNLIVDPQHALSNRNDTSFYYYLLFLGAVTAQCLPYLLKLPHYALAMAKNIMIDVNALGVKKALTMRLDPTPSRRSQQRTIDALWNSLRQLPISAVQKIMDHEKDKVLQDLMTEKPFDRSVSLQDDPISLDQNECFNQTLVELDQFHRKGFASGTFYLNQDLYRNSIAIRETMAKKGAHFANQLHSEHDITTILKANITMLSPLLGIDPNDMNLLYTSGGSASIFQAMSSYIQHTREHNNVTTPILLVSEYRHFAFDKAAQSCGATLIEIPSDNHQRINTRELQKAINWYGAKNIAAIVIAAPNYANGMTDDIECVANIASQSSIPCHLDACLGGFLNLFNDEPGPFEFPGITSVSADPHKFGYTGKGASLVAFRRSSSPQPSMQYITHPDGVYITPGLAGSLRGETAIELYATLTSLGKTELTRLAKNVIDKTRQLATKVNTIYGLKVIGIPDQLTCVVAITLDNDYYLSNPDSKPNIHAIADQLQKKLGASINYLPEGFHLCVTQNHADHPTYLNDFINGLEEIMGTIDPTCKGESQMASAYSHLGKQKLWGLPALPSEIAEAISEKYLHNAFGVNSG